MGWVNWPATDGTQDIQDWSWINQLPMAIRERHQMLGEKYWPTPSPAAFTGTISSITDNGDGTLTLTDSSLAPVPSGHTDDGSWWNGTQRGSDCTSGKYWVDVLCDSGPSGGEPYLDGFYDIIIENTDRSSDWYRRIMPWQVQRATHISDNTNNTVTFPRQVFLDWITSKLSPTTLSDLVGANYVIIRHTSTWWHERWPDWPNDNTLWTGTVSDSHIYEDDTGYIRELTNSVLNSPYATHVASSNRWTKDQWAGKEVLVYASDVLRRITISGNNSNTLFVGGITEIPTSPPGVAYSPSGSYVIGNANWRGYPNRDAFPIARWYGGKHRAIVAHPPDSDTVTTYGKVAAIDSDRWEELESIDSIGCGDDGSFVTPVALDVDLFVSQTNMCDGAAPAGSSRAPDLYKTIRGWQTAIENIVGFCIRPVDPISEIDPLTGQIPPYSRAQCFADCAINSGTASIVSETTGGGPDTDQYFTVSSTYKGLPIYYQVTDSTGKRLVVDNLGSADASTGRVAVTSNNPTWAGASVVYSAGWSRSYPREFTYMYPVDGYFMPDLDDIGAVVDPPVVTDFSTSGCAGVGSWYKRAVSTDSRVYTQYGTVSTGDTFTAGQLYRYTGDAWADGTLGYADDGIDVTDPYTDHGYEGLHPKTTQAQLRIDRSGAITDASAYYITDTTKHWWGEWFSGGTLIEQSGTATAATSSTLTTDTTRNDSGNSAHCWFQPGRFVGFDSAYEGFTIEIDHDGGDGSGLKTYKRQITSTSTSGSSVVIHFAAVDGVSFTAGDAWRIKEPKYKLNRWKGKRIQITKGDGTIIDALISGNDDQTLFITALDGTGLETPIETGWTYKIIEYETGGVWKFATTAPTDGTDYQKIGSGQYWIKPTGTDSRAPNPTFKTDQRSNEPNTVNTYGRMYHGDYILKILFDELYAMVNKLRWTTKPVTWSSRVDDAVPENNSRAADVSGPTPPDIDSFYKPQCDDIWNDPSSVSEGSGPPMVIAELAVQSGQAFVDLLRQYAYAVVTGVPTLLAHTVNIKTYGTTAQGFAGGNNGGCPPGDESGYENDTFDANGDGIAYNTWVTAASFGPDTSASYRVKVGSNDTSSHPTWPDHTPTDTDLNCSNGDTIFQYTEWRGYVVDTQETIVKWDVTGGLEFIA